MYQTPSKNKSKLLHWLINRKGYFSHLWSRVPTTNVFSTTYILPLVFSICPIFNVESSSKRPDADRMRGNSSNAFYPCLFERSVILFKNYIDIHVRTSCTQRLFICVVWDTVKIPFFSCRYYISMRAVYDYEFRDVFRVYKNTQFVHKTYVQLRLPQAKHFSFFI